MKTATITGPDPFGWYPINQWGETLQLFRTEKECRQWLADTARIRGIVGYSR
jgi:hypothetical protein